MILRSLPKGAASLSLPALLKTLRGELRVVHKDFERYSQKSRAAGNGQKPVILR